MFLSVSFTSGFYLPFQPHSLNCSYLFSTSPKHSSPNLHSGCLACFFASSLPIGLSGQLCPQCSVLSLPSSNFGTALQYTMLQVYLSSKLITYFLQVLLLMLSISLLDILFSDNVGFFVCRYYILHCEILYLTAIFNCFPMLVRE